MKSSCLYVCCFYLMYLLWWRNSLETYTAIHIHIFIAPCTKFAEVLSANSVLTRWLMHHKHIFMWIVGCVAADWLLDWLSWSIENEKKIKLYWIYNISTNPIKICGTKWQLWHWPNIYNFCGDVLMQSPFINFFVFHFVSKWFYLCTVFDKCKSKKRRKTEKYLICTPWPM